MDTSRIFSILCAFLLLITLTLSITTLVVLRNAVAESEATLGAADALINELDVAVGVLKEESIFTSTDTEAPSVDADILFQRFCMKETNGRIGIYTEDGYLVRIIDVDVTLLPKQEQITLQEGITVNSWRELVDLIQDYE